MEFSNLLNITDIVTIPGSISLPSYNQTIFTLCDTILGTLFGYFVYDINESTASKTFIISLFYNFLMPKPYSKLKMMSIMLLSFVAMRMLLKDNTYMVDGMLASVIQEIPSYEIMGVAISIMDSIPYLVEAYGNLGIQYIRKRLGSTNESSDPLDTGLNSSLLEPIYSKGGTLLSYIGTSMNTIILFLAIITSGLFFDTKDPDLPRPPRREDPSLSDFVRNQSKRSLVCGLYVFVEAYIKEGLSGLQSFVQLAKFLFAYTIYYALGSLKLDARLKNLATGTIFGLFFGTKNQNGTVGLSDMAALLILAPSSGVVRKAYLLYQQYMNPPPPQQKLSPRREILSMLEMIMAYSSGVFAAMTFYRLILIPLKDASEVVTSLCAQAIRLFIIFFVVSRVVKLDGRAFRDEAKKLKKKFPYLASLTAAQPKTQTRGSNGMQRNGSNQNKKAQKQKPVIPVSTGTLTAFQPSDTQVSTIN